MADRGEVAAKVISAESLSAAQVKTLAASMQGYVESGQKLIISQEVDESILGGVKIQIGDRFLDLSVSTKINQINKALSVAV